MNRKRLILYLAFAVYQIFSFIFTIMVDGHLDLLGLLRFIPWFKYMAFIGVVLFLVDFVWYLMDHRATKKRGEELERENNVLKAKIYDYQEAAKNADPIKKL
jgi:cell division protein FtsB